jgi:hypothetical protein
MFHSAGSWVALRYKLSETSSNPPEVERCQLAFAEPDSTRAIRGTQLRLQVGAKLGGTATVLVCVSAFFLAAHAVTKEAAEAASIALTTTCEAMVPAYCQGAFGFRLSATGAWQAGPSPDGRLSAGRLTRLEQSRLEAAVDQVLNRRPTSTEQCPSRPTSIPGVTETLIISDVMGRIVLRGSAGKIDPSCGAATRVNAALFGLVDSLMRRYYPKPFNTRR